MYLIWNILGKTFLKNKPSYWVIAKTNHLQKVSVVTLLNKFRNLFQRALLAIACVICLMSLMHIFISCPQSFQIISKYINEEELLLNDPLLVSMTFSSIANFISGYSAIHNLSSDLTVAMWYS